MALLATLGISRGDNIFVHSALGSFNNLEHGENTALQALKASVGGEGTILMPSFPRWLDVMATRTAFDLRNTPSNMGVLTETFRKEDCTVRSLHPTHPVIAQGPLAEALVSEHSHCPYAFGKFSPFFKHMIRKGKIVMIGVDLNSLTAFHIYEDLMAPTPWYPVYLEMTMQFNMINQEGKLLSYDGFFHSVEFARKREVERLTGPLRDRGFYRQVETDFSRMVCLDAAGLVATCFEELLRGRSAYGEVSVPIAEQQRIRGLMSQLPASN